MKSSLFIYLYAVCCFCISVYGTLTGQRNVFMFDNAGYHLYLPAAFIYHDVGKLSFYPAIDSIYQPTGSLKWYSIYPQPTGRKLNKYAIGHSIFEAPFFLTAHAYTRITGHYPADGYSLPYQLASVISYVIWSLLSLLLLRRFLSYYYGDTIVLITIATVALGTSYLYQAAMGGGSHVYGFLLAAAMLYYTHHWHRTYLNKYLYPMGIITGLALILRPVDALIITIPLFWGVYSKSTLQKKIRLLRRHSSPILLTVILCIAIAMLQMSYWKYTIGQWIYFSYVGEKFDFLHPHISRGLFSYRKGWFIYTPLALVAVAGFPFLWKAYKAPTVALLLTLCIAIYIVFSWTNWWYGGGFSARAMVDFLPLLALPLAALIYSTVQSKKIIKLPASIILLAFICLNLFQIWQYTQGIIHYDKMTKAYYWRVFGKTHYTEADLQYLMSDKEYWDGIRAAYN